MTDTNIMLTDQAAAHVRNYLAQQGGGDSFRIAVKPSGCSGHQYVVDTAGNIGEDDTTFECKGVKIVVDSQSLRYLAGTELDYVREGLNEGFRFNNPNVAQTCGCGESFSIAEDGA